MNIDFGGEVNRLTEAFAAWLPRVIGALVYFLIGWLVAVALRSLTEKGLVRLGFNRWVNESPAEGVARKISTDPARSIGNFVYWLVIIITITIVIGTLQIPVLTGIVAGIYGYIPNILGAIVILAVGMALSALVSTIAGRWLGDTKTGRIAGTVIPSIIMLITGFAVLEQLKLAPIIVSSTYIAVLSALSLAFAIAFGLGGAEAAGRIMDTTYESGSKTLEQARRDVEKGRERAERDAKEAKKRANH